MEPDVMQERQQAHALLDRLTAERLNVVRNLLEVMIEPPSLAHSLAAAPVEEERITPETESALSRARASLAHGEGIPHEEILREFGLPDADHIGAVSSAPCRSSFTPRASANR